MRRPALEGHAQLREGVRVIVQEVRAKKDQALREFTSRFDGVKLESVLVTPQEIQEALGLVSPKSLKALNRAKSQIEAFHQKQLPATTEVETAPGVRCQRQWRAIERVGLYVPAGSAPLPSTVLMLAIPALIAGCKTKVLCAPPRKDGKLDPHILVAAHLCGVNVIAKVGGAQAVAAMAYGTESVPKVDKIFGPGNSWVTQAKILVAEDPEGAAYDMPAGPSEVLVIADAQARAEFVASDLLSQAEHGPDSQVVLVSNSAELIAEVEAELSLQLALLSRRDIAAQALSKSFSILVASIEQAIEVSNQYAPEHLIIQTSKASQWAPQIQHAGSVFLGAFTPESMGDYASDTNHVLPTYGFARAYGGLSVDAFFKQMTFQELTEAGIRDLGPVVETLAELEGLDGHKNAVSVRLKFLGAGND